MESRRKVAYSKN